MRRLSLIAAMARNRVIGDGESMPWHLPADMQRFRQATLGKPVIMGRATYASIGKALPKRDNIVLTRSADFSAPGCQVCASLDEALSRCADKSEVMVIGGGQIYALALPLANYMYLTYIDADLEGATRFPPWPGSEWQEMWREHHDADERNAHAMTFVNLARVVTPPQAH